MVKKDNIQEQIEMISYLMSYDRSLILSEQPESVMDRRIGIEDRNMTALNIPKTSQGYKEYSDLTQPWAKIDSHILLPILSFALYMSAPITGPVGPALAIALEVADAAVYSSEGDDFSAGLTLAFALIPFGELVTNIPGVKKYGKKFVMEALKKAKLGKKLSKVEIEVVEQVSKSSKELTKRANQELIKKTVSKTFSKLPLKSKISKFRELQIKYPKTFGLASTGIQIGGIFYSWCQIAKTYNITGPDVIEWCKAEQKKQNVSKPLDSKPIIITDFGDDWDYKKEGNQYYTKKKGTDKWILATGKPEEAIKTKVFKIDPSVEVSNIKSKLNMTKEQIDQQLTKKVLEGINVLTPEQRDSVITDFVTTIL